MFGLHCRNRSLIPVRDMDKSEKMASKFESIVWEHEDPEPQTPRQQRNLTMIYLLFLAEAIMSSSLSSQINILLPSATSCLTMDTSFLRSILQCAYFFGSATGLLWGLMADKLGRRRVALIGLCGMSACCMAMGFANDFTSFAVLRYAAGVISSAATVSGLAMLSDSTHGSSSQRTRVVARLPLIAVCGQLGPFLSSSIHHFAKDHLSGFFSAYPGLIGQIACAGIISSLTIGEVLLLEETLPGRREKLSRRNAKMDCEKAAFLGQVLADDSVDSLNISIIDALNDDTATPRTSWISITEMLTAPSILALLASFSILSLHSSTFEILLPHLGQTASHQGGMGIPCSWLGTVMLIIKVLAATRVMRVVPFIVQRVGLLPMYRRISMVFPALYIIIPMVALSASGSGTSVVLSATVGILATLIKTTLAGSGHVLVLLLALSAAPDAASTGTLIGVVQISELFKALAVGLAGICYYLSTDYSMLVVNASLWAALVSISVLGAGITWKLRERARVGTDLPEDCFVWQGFFDAESDDQGRL